MNIITMLYHPLESHAGRLHYYLRFHA